MGRSKPQKPSTRVYPCPAQQQDANRLVTLILVFKRLGIPVAYVRILNPFVWQKHKECVYERMPKELTFRTGFLQRELDDCHSTNPDRIFSWPDQQYLYDSEQHVVIREKPQRRDDWKKNNKTRWVLEKTTFTECKDPRGRIVHPWDTIRNRWRVVPKRVVFKKF